MDNLQKESTIASSPLGESLASLVKLHVIRISCNSRCTQSLTLSSPRSWRPLCRCRTYSVCHIHRQSSSLPKCSNAMCLGLCGRRIRKDINQMESQKLRRNEEYSLAEKGSSRVSTASIDSPSFVSLNGDAN